LFSIQRLKSKSLECPLMQPPFLFKTATFDGHMRPLSDHQHSILK
jgi:hypothetical protein